MSGVYALRNTIDGRIYVGSTTRAMRTRWAEHRKALRKGDHHSIFLQRAWIKHGELSFTFFVIEVVLDAAKILEREQFWLDHFQSSQKTNGYNISPTAGNCAGRIVSDATKAKIGAAATGRKPSIETRMKMAESHRGRVISDEAKRKISLSQKGLKRAPLSAEHRANISAGGKGKKRSPETRAKLSVVASARVMSDATRAKIAISNKLRSPETIFTREKRAKRMRELWADAAYREAMMATRSRNKTESC